MIICKTVVNNQTDKFKPNKNGNSSPRSCLFGEKALSVSIVSYTNRSRSRNKAKLNLEIHASRPPNSKIGQIIIECLYPTLSCCEIAKIIRVDYSSVRYVLINKLN